MIQSFRKLTDEPPGFRAERLLTMRIELSDTKYQSFGQRVTFYRELLERVERLPGVLSAGFVTMLPLTFSGGSIVFGIEGRPESTESEPLAVFRSVSSDYFRTMGIPLVNGRAFGERDDEKSPHVALVNQALARRYFPGEDPAGRRISIWGSPHEIIGIVGDVRELELGNEPPPAIYVSAFQRSFGFFDPRDLAVRTRSDLAILSAAIRAELRGIDPNQPVSRIQTMEKIVAGSTSTERTHALLFGAFGGVALLLAAIGVYGVMSYTVSRRTGEIGLRMALGARSRDVLKMLLAQGMKLVLTGLAIGIAVALTLARFLGGMLYQVEPTDPWTLTGVAALLAAVALVSCLVPGLRAARIDPLVAVREE